MPNTSKNDEAPRRGRPNDPNDLDEDDTLHEVGEDKEFELDDDGDPADRRLDPLRQPR